MVDNNPMKMSDRTLPDSSNVNVLQESVLLLQQMLVDGKQVESVFLFLFGFDVSDGLKHLLFS